MEIAEECVREDAGISVTVIARGKVEINAQKLLGKDLHDIAYTFENIPRWMLGSFCNKRPTLPAIDLGFNEFRKKKQIQVIEGDEVTGFEESEKFVLFKKTPKQQFDVVVAATGYNFEVCTISHGIELHSDLTL